MIAFKIIDPVRDLEEFLDLYPNSSISTAINNPLFSLSETAGTLTYPSSIPFTKRNQKFLGFPEILVNEIDTLPSYTCHFYLLGILWKIGKLTYRGFSGRDYIINFLADAGDLAELIKDKSLRSLDLGSETFSSALSSVYPASNYAIFPIRNKEFFAGKFPAYNGYLNYYNSGFQFANSAKVPFPFLPYILTKTAGLFSYQLTGGWLTEEDTLKTVIYNTTSLDSGTEVIFNKHVPDLTVGQFLQAIRALYGLSYIIDATGKIIKIVKLKDVIKDNSYIEWTSKADQVYSDEIKEDQGFTLLQQIETADELNKTLSSAQAEMKIGLGRDQLETKASTLHTIKEADLVTPSRSWLLPVTSHSGNSNQYQTGENKFSFRLLKYYGLQADSLGNSYPLGTAIAEDFAGNPLAGNSLHWAGSNGLYENNYKAWLDFLAVGRPIERTVRLNIADLLNLDPTKKIMIENVKAFFTKISLNVSMKEGIGKAKIDFIKTKL